MIAAPATYEDDDLRRIRRLLKIGKRVGIAGLTVLLIGGAMLGTGLFQIFKGLSQTREQLAVEVAVPGTGQVHLEEGTYDLVVIGQGLLERSRNRDGERGPLVGTGYREPDVRISGRTGTPAVTAIGSNSHFSYANNNYDLVSMNAFRVHQSGTYLIEVTGEPGPVETIGIGPTTGTPGGALALGGGAVLGLGALITIGGIITYVIGHTRRNRHRATFGPMPGWAPAPGPPGSAYSPQHAAPPSGWAPPPPPPPPPSPPPAPPTNP